MIWNIYLNELFYTNYIINKFDLTYIIFEWTLNMMIRSPLIWIDSTWSRATIKSTASLVNASFHLWRSSCSCLGIQISQWMNFKRTLLKNHLVWSAKRFLSTQKSALIAIKLSAFYVSSKLLIKMVRESIKGNAHIVKFSS